MDTQANRLTQLQYPSLLEEKGKGNIQKLKVRHALPPPPPPPPHTHTHTRTPPPPPPPPPPHTHTHTHTHRNKPFRAINGCPYNHYLLYVWSSNWKMTNMGTRNKLCMCGLVCTYVTSHVLCVLERNEVFLWSTP